MAGWAATPKLEKKRAVDLLTGFTGMLMELQGGLHAAMKHLAANRVPTPGIPAPCKV